ncbi:MAG: M3 family metallopeptidase, partial [Planctomycetota bacterium]
WVATIDAFQHWIYTHPDHDHEARDREWLAIMDRFATGVDWSGVEDVRRKRWVRQSHLFGVPFYYVEYAIAQLGALQVWRNYREDPRHAVEAYRHALSLGNTRPLRELFQAAEIRFDFSEQNLEQLLLMVDEEIERLKTQS